MLHFQPIWFQLGPTDLSFVDSPPYRFSVQSSLAAPPERVFEIFAAPERMQDWIVGFDGCTWMSQPPCGVGARREFRLKGLAFQERFIAWEPGRRLCFAIEAMTVPLMRRMVEDIRIQPDGAAASRLEWRVLYEPSHLFRPVHRVARPLFHEGYQRSVDRLARYVLQHRRSAA